MKTCQASQSLSQDLNLGPSLYEAGVLATQPQCSEIKHGVTQG
jgi:hypothetical protein